MLTDGSLFNGNGIYRISLDLVFFKNRQCTWHFTFSLSEGISSEKHEKMAIFSELI